MDEINDKMQIIYNKLNLIDVTAHLKNPVSAQDMYDRCFPKKLVYLHEALGKIKNG